MKSKFKRLGAVARQVAVMGYTVTRAIVVVGGKSVIIAAVLSPIYLAGTWGLIGAYQWYALALGAALAGASLLAMWGALDVFRAASDIHDRVDASRLHYDGHDSRAEYVLKYFNELKDGVENAISQFRRLVPTIPSVDGQTKDGLLKFWEPLELYLLSLNVANLNRDAWWKPSDPQVSGPDSDAIMAPYSAREALAKAAGVLAYAMGACLALNESAFGLFNGPATAMDTAT